MSTYGIELQGKELTYFFFKKKTCPLCGSKMKKVNRTEYLGKGLDSVKLGEFYYGDRYETTLFYRCENCNKAFSIGELSGEDEVRKNQALHKERHGEENK